MSEYKGYAHVKCDHDNHRKESAPDNISSYPIYGAEAKYANPLKNKLNYIVLA